MRAITIDKAKRRPPLWPFIVSGLSKCFSRVERTVNDAHSIELACERCHCFEVRCPRHPASSSEEKRRGTASARQCRPRENDMAQKRKRPAGQTQRAFAKHSRHGREVNHSVTEAVAVDDCEISWGKAPFMRRTKAFASSKPVNVRSRRTWPEPS